MIGWIVYFAGVVVCTYPLGQWIVDTMPGKNDSVDRALLRGFGFLVSTIWPLVLIGVLCYKLSKKVWSGIFEDEKEKLNG